MEKCTHIEILQKGSDMNQKISVVLTLLNEASNIEDTLKAILSQSFPVNEIIIVDGGSTDDTCMIIKKYATQDSRIKLYEAPGLNIAQGRNYAIERAQSEIIAVTDGGCVPRIDWLKELIIPMIGPENYVAVAISRYIFTPFCTLNTGSMNILTFHPLFIASLILSILLSKSGVCFSYISIMVCGDKDHDKI